MSLTPVSGWGNSRGCYGLAQQGRNGRPSAISGLAGSNLLVTLLALAAWLPGAVLHAQGVKATSGSDPIAGILASGASTPMADGQAGLAVIGYANGELVSQATLAAGSQISTWTLPPLALVLPPTGDFSGDGREDLIVLTSEGLALVSPSPPVRSGQPGGWRLPSVINNGSKAGGWQIVTDHQIVSTFTLMVIRPVS